MSDSPMEGTGLAGRVYRQEGSAESVLEAIITQGRGCGDWCGTRYAFNGGACIAPYPADLPKKYHPQVAFFDRFTLGYSGLALLPVLYDGTLVPGTVLFGLD